MKHRVLVTLAATLSIAFNAGVAQGQSKDIKDEVEQSVKAATAFNEIMAAPDKAIPQGIVERAECIMVFPSVISAAFGVGGRGGRGVASCRTPSGWSAPAYFNLGGGSFGFQIGVEATDLVMLFMTTESANKLIGSKFELGADATVAAGPIGRQAGASTDLKLGAQILSYSRSKGLFAGVALKGAVIQPASGDMRDVYGEGASAKTILKQPSDSISAAVRAFPEALSRSTRKATK
jgi:lipid-binding SYLF domain-containing protein